MIGGEDTQFLWDFLTACIIPLGMWLVRLQVLVNSKADDGMTDGLRDRVTALESNKADKSEVTLILTEMATIKERVDNNTKATDKMDGKLDVLLERIKGQS